jgi:hypothetical protein
VAAVVGATLETSVALRAVAILFIVGSHAGLFELWGGAHLLLGVAGYNFGRFCLTPVPRTDRVRHLRNTIACIAGSGLALRYDILGLHLGRDAWFTVVAFWFFAMGWTAAKASTTLQRAAVTVVLIIGLHGYFDRTERELLVLAGFALLIWVPALRCPPAATVVAGVIAEASLYIYLTHYQVYPLFGGHPLLGVVASIVVGVLLTHLVTVLRKRIRGSLGSLSSTKVPALR